jgi:hypothetical protein
MWCVFGSQINSNYDILWKHRRAFDEVIEKFNKWSMSFEEYISKKEVPYFTDYKTLRTIRRTLIFKHFLKK